MQNSFSIVDLVIADLRDETTQTVKGQYWGNGDVECTIIGKVSGKKVQYRIESNDLYVDDPRRFFRMDTNEWSSYRLLSMILNAKALKKSAKTQ